ncbi:MAG: helix-turn-helix domain-containing protein [Thermoguttaceae bacterium]
MSNHARDNLHRIVAAAGMSVCQVARLTGLDKRTVSGILSGTKKPRANTLHRLAKGLNVSINEFFIDPAQLLYRRFDRLTNPLVEEIVSDHVELFRGWTEADFEELHSRFGKGGSLTHEGTLHAVRLMNRKRELYEKLDVLLESTQAEVTAEILEVLYKKVALSPKRA